MKVSWVMFVFCTDPVPCIFSVNNKSTRVGAFVY